MICLQSNLTFFSSNISSLTINAAGRGDRWYSATGWCAYTTRGVTAADALASSLYNASTKFLSDHRLRTDYTDGDHDLEADFYILRHTLCPSCLSENGFMDAEESLSFLESEAGKKAIVALHVEGIINYINSCR